MKKSKRRIIGTGTAAVILAAAALAAPPIALPLLSVDAAAQAQTANPPHPAPRRAIVRNRQAPVRPGPKNAAKATTKPATKAATTAAPKTAKQKLPPRIPFTAEEDAAATIPGMPDARFFADSTADFNKALPSQPGPWLILSTGGADGAFGVGVLNGLSAGGHRPDYAVVTGVSTGALMAPFAFVGAKYDDELKGAYTHITAADVFEAGSTPESFVDTWPLKDLLAKLITPELMGEIAAEYKKGRRLFVVTTDLDAQRSVVWNMGAIAAHAGPDENDPALHLFRDVLLASGSIPAAFPPVLIDVEANGKPFQEMHVDGGVGGQFFVAPPALLESNSGYRIPATQLDIVINSSLQPDFGVVERSTPLILTQSVSMAVKTDLRLMLDRVYVAAKNSGIGFNVAAIPADFSAPNRGGFDPKYMQALFDAGFAQGKSATPFVTAPPPFPGQPPATQASDPSANGKPVMNDTSPSDDTGRIPHDDVQKPGADK